MVNLAENSNSNTVTGLAENIEGVLCYSFGFVTGIIFLILEKKNEFVRFHAMQSVITFLGYYLFIKVAIYIPILGWLLAMLTWPLGLLLWVLLVFKAYKGERYKLPYIGDFAEKLLGKQISNT